ncbi:DUF1592 domain-containing protein [Mangrovimicrobium sediminis]|nr:DUF1592 domain-containing protein [Haliea sp. SAOS-164]
MHRDTGCTARRLRGGALALLLLPLGLALPLGGCGEGDSVRGEPPPVGGPPLVRRLTESQYRATLADVFGPETPVLARFERGIRSHGLVAVGTSEAGISPFSVEQYAAAAIGVADAVLAEDRRAATVPCEPRSAQEFDAACATHFVERYGPLLLRRPLTPAQVERFVTAAGEGSAQMGGFYAGLKYALIGMLTAPEFLLRIERTRPDPQHPGLRQLDAWSRAERLSYFLTDSTPDAELLRAAGAGELETREGLARQVDRLIASPAFARAVRAFFADMLEFDELDDVVKDLEIYPAFDSEVIADAREQTLRDITRVLIERDGDYRDLFTLRETALTRPLGVVYRLPVATRHGWELGEFPAEGGRAGIQSHISFLALHAHPGRSSPTLRGESIREIFLCQDVPDPPANVNFSLVQDDANAAMPTARDRLVAHRTEPACAGCHKIMDPPGLGLENFDGLGTYRERENGAAIDASGELDGVPFSDPGEFAQALRNHRETPVCLAETLYRYAVGRDTVWDERAYMDYLVERFAASGYRVPALMRTIALSDNFFAIAPSAEAGTTASVAQHGGNES